ncbi:hypothetical protein [Natronorubrum texcoconense]|uniref:Uncharacterized protein n=1 Tax=Natronorubrum texcoconense TaxID=1095776 RepID=A0A1G9E148_9EURY|nr:hypothetical protein [Natronorubrum texcoconense]SDK69824.1 hypothetical protein SAMN04515672_3713 [Natronorubrum texcoconense]
MTASDEWATVRRDIRRRLPVSPRRIVTSPATLATFALLVVPFGLGWLETRLFSPLALPGYLLYGVGTAIGNAVAPRFDLWVYWVPFLGGSAGIAVIVGFGFEWWRERRTGDSMERL